jgi:transposase
VPSIDHERIAGDAGDEALVGAGAVEVGASDRVVLVVDPVDVGCVDRDAGGKGGAADESLVDRRAVVVGAADRRAGHAEGGADGVAPVDRRAGREARASARSRKSAATSSARAAVTPRERLGRIGVVCMRDVSESVADTATMRSVREQFDLRAIEAGYRADGWGQPAHDPAMMVALLLHACATGERSSRAIERRCCDDVAVRVITANLRPDHATIARFRVRHQDALADLFGDVLALCARAGVVSVGTIAVDGTKIRANASRTQNRSYRELAREILDEADEVDAAEDIRFGDRRGDELPPEMGSLESRRERLRELKRQLDAEREQRADSLPPASPSDPKSSSPTPGSSTSARSTGSADEHCDRSSARTHPDAENRASGAANRATNRCPTSSSSTTDATSTAVAHRSSSRCSPTRRTCDAPTTSDAADYAAAGPSGD